MWSWVVRVVSLKVATWWFLFFLKDKVVIVLLVHIISIYNEEIL